MTFSQHAAATRYSTLYYALLFMLTLPMVYLFFDVWLVPVKHLPSFFLWFAGIAITLQILCSFVPETGGVKTIIHRGLAALSALFLIPLVIIIATASSMALSVHVLAWVSATIMTVLLAIAFTHQRGHSNAIWLQVGYYGVFFTVILLATYSPV